MYRKKMDEILERHKLWLDRKAGGERADLREADMHGFCLYGENLSYAILIDANMNGMDLFNIMLDSAELCNASLFCANLHKAMMRHADLYNAKMYDADLCDAELSGADLFRAELCEADLRSAKLIRADLRYADLRYADMTGADISGANLYRAKLSGAILDGVKSSAETKFFALRCPATGSYIAYKAAGGLIVELEIPADAERSSATSEICRASKAKVRSITDVDGNPAGNCIRSDFSKRFKYVVGKTVEVSNFDPNRWNERAPGIHHFMTRREAVEYAG